MYHFSKRFSLLFLLIFFSFGTVFAQRIPVIGVVAFQASGTGINPTDLANVTGQVVSELSSWGTLTVVQGDTGAEYVIRGTLSRQSTGLVLSGSTSDANGTVLNEFTEQGRAIADLSITMFCAKAVERVSLPNYLLGTWESVINMPDGPVVCIMEFRSNRTVRVERYDTWEHRQQNALRYEGYGAGTYTYIGYANRIVNISGQQVRIDAAASINLTLEETLPDQTSVSMRGLYLVFNGDRNAFEIVNAMLPCGRNFDGPSVYHSAVIGFTQFRKIR